jgi:hypothetical protein
MPEACCPVSKDRRKHSEDDLWLAQLYVLIRPAQEPVSEESVLAYVRRRKIREVTTAKLRRLLSSLVRKGIVRPTNGCQPAFVATRRGRKAAAEASARLSRLLELLNGRASG